MIRIYQKNHFYILLILNAVIWTILPVLFHKNMPLDMTELVSWGHEWQWGYYKHPPLSSWIAEFIMVLTHNGQWAYYATSQICVVIALLCTAHIAKDFLDKDYVFLSALLLQTIYYYNFITPEFNPNILQIPLWAGIILCLWRCVKTDKIIYWVILGILSACGILAKYYTAILLLSAVLMLIYVPKYRSIWKDYKIYCAFFIFLLFLSPHLIWLVKNDFQTFYYIQNRSDVVPALGNHIIYPFKFFIAQTTAIITAVIVFFVCYYKSAKILPKLQIKDLEKSYFLFFMAIVPFLMTVAISCLLGIRLRSMWGTPLWNMVGIVLFFFFTDNTIIKQAKEKFIKNISISILCLMGIAMAAYSINFRYFFHERADFNGRTAAEKIFNIWQKELDNMPLNYVMGDLWLGGNIAYYLPHRASVFIDNDIKKSPWIDINLLKYSGYIMVWNADSDGKNIPNIYNSNNMPVVKHGILDIPWHNDKKTVPYKMGWAIIKPH